MSGLTRRLYGGAGGMHRTLYPDAASRAADRARQTEQALELARREMDRVKLEAKRVDELSKATAAKLEAELEAKRAAEHAKAQAARRELEAKRERELAAINPEERRGAASIVSAAPLRGEAFAPDPLPPFHPNPDEL